MSTNPGDWGQPCTSKDTCNETDLYCMKGVNNKTFNPDSICCSRQSFTYNSNGDMCCTTENNPSACVTDFCDGVQCQGACYNGVCCDSCLKGCDGVDCGSGGKCNSGSCCASGLVLGGECCPNLNSCNGQCLPEGYTCCMGQIVCKQNETCCRRGNGNNPQTTGCDPTVGKLGGPRCDPTNKYGCHWFGDCPVS
jgi:hypothetical protein